jgi:hypothetical protein
MQNDNCKSRPLPSSSYRLSLPFCALNAKDSSKLTRERSRTRLTEHFAHDRREKKIIIQKFNQTATLQSDFELLRETLLHEQSRASALEVEKRTPVRIHPWRTMQVSDHERSDITRPH